MKNALLKIAFAAFLIVGSVQFSKATLYTIEASDFQFTQPFDSILVGDTVKWVWINGSHTTTSNGIPFGAPAWNILLDKLHTSFTYVVTIGGTYDYISVPDAPQMGGEFVASWPTGISNPSLSITNFFITGNPVRNNIQFYISSLKAHEAEISLYNILGTKIQTLYRGNIPDGEFQQSVPISSAIPGGIYFVSLSLKDNNEKPGSAMLTRRIVMQ